MGVKRSCFKVELQPVQVLVAQTPEIDAPARHEVLFDGANSVVLIWQIVDARNLAIEATRSAPYQFVFEQAPIAGGQQETIGIRRAIQFTIGDAGSAANGRGCRDQG